MYWDCGTVLIIRTSSLPRAHGGRVIVLSVGRSVCLFVCLFVCTKSGLSAKQASLWALLATNVSEIEKYLPHERERTSGSREKQAFHLFWLC